MLDFDREEPRQVKKSSQDEIRWVKKKWEDGLGSDFESANRLARYERGGILRLMLETKVEGLVYAR